MRRTKYYPFTGGLNLVNSPIVLKPGTLIGASNFEISSIANTGYRRIDGYERFDGNQKPSEASYWYLTFDEGTNAILTNDVLGEVSGTGAQTINMVALADAVLDSGAWDGTGVGYVAVGFDSSTGLINADNMADNEPVYENTTFKARSIGIPSPGGALTDALDETYLHLAIEHSRGIIQAVPGIGDIRGVWYYNGSAYVFRDNAGGTAVDMYKSTATGLALQSLGYEIAFTGGTVQEVGPPQVNGVNIGDTITGSISGATAVITQVVLTSGSWSNGDAVGYMYFSSQTGTFQAENIDVGAKASMVAIADDSTANVLPVGGYYEFVNENFYGSAGTKRMYGCNGVGNAFEWDGTNFFFIHTGMDTDAPIHITEHKKHLFLAFRNGSVQHSTIGVPLEWNVITGAGQIGTGDEITGFVTLVGDALGIFNRNRTYILYGTALSGSDPWNLVELSDESGAIERTIQRMGKPIYFDDRGFTNMTAVQAFGDFNSAIFSQPVKPIVDVGKKKVISSLRIRDKNQYRVFFSDKTFLITSFDGNKVSGFMPCEYDVSVICTCSSEDTDGTEVLFFGSTDGYLYQMDKGTSLDGEMLSSFIRPAFNFIGNTERIKRFFKTVMEVEAFSPVTIKFTPDFDYSSTDDITHDLTVSSGGGSYNVDNWDEINWSEAGVGNPESYIDGSGKNIGMNFYHESIYDKPFTIHGMTLHYSERGLVR